MGGLNRREFVSAAFAGPGPDSGGPIVFVVVERVSLMRHVVCSVLVLCVLGGVCCGADWPQFRGINRDGKSPETGLMKKWLQGGPELLWAVDSLGDGWSSAAIAKGLVYITGKIDKEGHIFCFDLDGKLKWKVSYGPEWVKSYPGSRTTPTVDDGRLYVFSGMGVASCHNAATGRLLWERDVFSEFDGVYPRWGMSECLLVDKGKVFCAPGGISASVVALDKLTGEIIWACEDVNEPSTYSNPIAFDHAGVRMVVYMLRDSVVGINSRTGELLWRHCYDEYHIDRNRWVNANPPLYHEGCVYTTSGYDNGGAMVQLTDDPHKIRRKWVDKVLDVHHGGTVLVDGYIYGSNYKSYTKGDWACLQWDTGKVMYDDKWQGNKGSLIYADGMLYCYDENTGHVALVPADPEEFEPASSFEIARKGKGRYWAHPSISDGRLYIRHGEYLMCYGIED